MMQSSKQMYTTPDMDVGNECELGSVNGVG